MLLPHQTNFRVRTLDLKPTVSYSNGLQAYNKDNHPAALQEQGAMQPILTY